MALTRLGGGLPGPGMLLDQLFHGLPVLRGQIFVRQGLEQEVLLLAVVAAVGIGADEIHRGVDEHRVHKGKLRVHLDIILDPLELPRHEVQQAFDQAVFDHQRADGLHNINPLNL